MIELLGKLKNHTLIHNVYKKKMETLLLRLRNKNLETNAMDEKVSNVNNQNLNSINAKHVMLSYCWNQTANPQHVKMLAKELKSLGVDVWRDEDGSSIVPPMSGSVDERMAEAIQCSDIVVICVSAAYKKSSNCRLEASYA